MRRLGEAVVTLLFVLLSLLVAVRLRALVEGPSSAALLIPAALLAVVVTDLISGLVHWFCDSYFADDTPLLGPLLIRPFREHHRDPLAMTRRPLLEVNSSNAAVMLPAQALVLGLVEPRPGALSVFGYGFLLFFGVAVYLTNTIHCWAHRPSVARPVRWLQRARLVIPPDHHARHHRAGHGSYCITTGWLNPLLDGLGVFPCFERCVVGLRPRLPDR